MRAKITAGSISNLTPRSSPVWSDADDIEVDNHLGSLWVSARYRHNTNAGARGGSREPVERTLQIQLSKADLFALIQGATKSGFLKEEEIILPAAAKELRAEIERLRGLAADQEAQMHRLRAVHQDCIGMLSSVSPN